MKSKAAILWFVVAMALAATLATQWISARKAKLKLEQLQVQVEKRSTQEKQAEGQVQELERQLTALRGELRTAEFELNKMRGAPEPASSQARNAQPGGADIGMPREGEQGGGGMGKMLAGMMKDPEMRKALEQQQKMGLEMMYGSLFKELKLTPEQENKFRELVLAQQMDNMSNAGALFEGEGDRAAIAQGLAEKNAKDQEQIKQLLGDEKYAQYQEYNQTISERLMLDQLGKQADISPEQNDQLLAIIREEKKNVQINWGQPAPDPTKDWQQMLSGEAGEKIFAQQEEVNNRVVERAGQVLTAEQLQKLEPLLKSQLEMQKAGLRMAREMFKNKEGTQPQPPPQ